MSGSNWRKIDKLTRHDMRQSPFSRSSICHFVDHRRRVQALLQLERQAENGRIPAQSRIVSNVMPHYLLILSINTELQIERLRGNRSIRSIWHKLAFIINDEHPQDSLLFSNPLQNTLGNREESSHTQRLQHSQETPHPTCGSRAHPTPTRTRGARHHKRSSNERQDLPGKRDSPCPPSAQDRRAAPASRRSGRATARSD